MPQLSDGKKILITVNGKDTPGITSGLTEILSRAEVKLLDIEQAVTNGLVSLSFVVQFKSAAADSQAVLKDLLFKAKELGLMLDFHDMQGEAVLQSSATQFAITLMSEELQAKHVAAVSSVLASKSVNIDSIRKLNEGGLYCLEIIANTKNSVDLEDLKGELLRTTQKFSGLDIAVQRENLFRRAKRLVVLDMDSTLVQVEIIDELAKLAGVEKKVVAITKRAMSGDMDFDESLKQRVALLKGLALSRLSEIQVPLTPGAEVLIKTLKNLGYKIALISGGFTYFAEPFREKLGLHYVYANTLEVADGALTGRVLGAIVNAQKKADLMREIAKLEQISLGSVIAIGDGSNDIPMLKAAGLGIAFNGKKKTREAAKAAINQKTLASILYLLGITDKDIEAVSG